MGRNDDLWQHKGSSLGWIVLAAVLAAGWLLSSSPAAGAYLIYYGVIGLAVAMAAMFLYLIYWFVHNWLSPVTRVRARVLRKTSRDCDVSIVGDTPESAAASLGMLGRDPEAAAEAWSKAMDSPNVPEKTLYFRTDFYITFDCGGRESEFLVPEEVYVDLPEGAEGLLIYQGEQFRQFLKKL